MLLRSADIPNTLYSFGLWYTSIGGLVDTNYISAPSWSLDKASRTPIFLISLVLGQQIKDVS